MCSAKRKECFYNSEKWARLKVAVKSIYSNVCMNCRDYDCETHCDHIKPRSIYPELSLDIKNIQILCRECNLKKSNTNENDFRTQYQREQAENFYPKINVPAPKKKVRHFPKKKKNPTPTQKKKKLKKEIIFKAETIENQILAIAKIL